MKETTEARSHSQETPRRKRKQRFEERERVQMPVRVSEANLFSRVLDVARVFAWPRVFVFPAPSRRNLSPNRVITTAFPNTCAVQFTSLRHRIRSLREGRTFLNTNYGKSDDSTSFGRTMNFTLRIERKINSIVKKALACAQKVVSLAIFLLLYQENLFSIVTICKSNC